MVNAIGLQLRNDLITVVVFPMEKREHEIEYLVLAAPESFS